MLKSTQFIAVSSKNRLANRQDQLKNQSSKSIQNPLKIHPKITSKIQKNPINIPIFSRVFLHPQGAKEGPLPVRWALALKTLAPGRVQKWVEWENLWESGWKSGKLYGKKSMEIYGQWQIYGKIYMGKSMKHGNIYGKSVDLMIFHQCKVKSIWDIYYKNYRRNGKVAMDFSLWKIRTVYMENYDGIVSIENPRIFHVSWIFP